MVVMASLTEQERLLLEKLADAGKPTELFGEDRKLAISLESDKLLFMVRNTHFAVITPKGRHVLESKGPTPKPDKKPFGFLK
jgi:hypothetical protein